MTDTTEADVPEVDPAEAEASKMGWKPEADWDGEPDRWVPAGEFVEMKERQLKRADVAAQNEIRSLRSEISEMKRTFEQFGEYHSKTEQRAYQRAMKQIQTDMDKAVADGDTETYGRLKAEAVEVSKSAADIPQPTKRADNPDQDPDFLAFVKENEWYVKDVRMRNRANNLAQDVAAVTGTTGAEFYDEISKVIREEFPEKFERKNGRMPAVEGAGSSVSRKAAKKTWENIPAKDREQIEPYIKDKLLTKEQYVKEYFEDD